MIKRREARGIRLYMMVLALFLSAGCLYGQRMRMDLQGQWAFKLDVRGNGVEEGYPTALFAEEVVLPGTTDTNAKGYPNLRRDETTSLSRTHTYAGKAWYKREVDIPAEWGGKAVILSMERTKPTRVWVDGKDAGCNDNISTCQVYDLTRFLAPGRHEIAVMVDNGGGFPPELLAASHAFAEATQTNWNGILGEIFLEARNRLHIEDVRVSPDAEKRLVRVKVRVAGADQMAPDTWLEAAAEAWNTSDAHRPVPRRWQLEKGKAEYEFDYSLGNEAQLWSEYHPVLYRLDLALGGATGSLWTSACVILLCGAGSLPSMACLFFCGGSTMPACFR